MMNKKIYIYGKHAIMEALSYSSHAIDEILISSQFDNIALRELIHKRGVKTAVLTPQKMPREIDADAVHQGIIGLLSLGRLILPFETFLKNLAIGPDTSLVLLGELSDPQNVGAIIRSAAAFGISGVLIPERNQAQITGSVVKVSAGMAFRVPLVSVANVNGTLRVLKDRGFAVYGLAGDAKYTVTKEQFELPTVFVLGNEAEGIREKTIELCDKLLSIPINPNCESLNAAACATVAFYAWSAKHPKALKAINLNKEKALG